MATYFGTTINDSPTVIYPAKAEIKEAQGKAAVITGGEVALATSADKAMGVIPLSEDETIEAGRDVTVQVKDIGVWIAGGTIAIGDELTADDNGCCVKAEAGKYVLGIALSAAAEAGGRVRFQICKYVAA